jgi:hypothetical protein
MAGLVPAIHALSKAEIKAWMPGPRFMLGPAKSGLRAGHDEVRGADARRHITKHGKLCRFFWHLRVGCDPEILVFALSAA